ncbi:MAG: TolB protein [Phycisphaerales bacterium]|jgi:TolB protein
MLTTLAAFLTAPALALQPAALTNPGWDSTWPELEAPFLSNHRQITRREDFLKAGESYFNPAGNMVIFQGVPVPPEGEEPAEHYMMYVSTLGDEGPLTQVAAVSQPGSASTCGWFHPLKPDTFLLGTTTVPPSSEETAAYQRESSKYSWDFPREMEIVVMTGQVAAVMSTEGGYNRFMARSTEPLFERDGYDAESSWSPDGRFVLYTHCEPGSNDGDLWIFDTTDESHTELVAMPGYDGGPFFSPDGTRICYRSDRGQNDLLQVYVSDLVFDEAGKVTAITNETQLTENKHVNWAPFFTPDGEYLFYATSELGHANYEVFAVSSKVGPGVRPQLRITHARGFDGLPVFNAQGTKMMWTAQRGPQAEGEGKPSSQLWVADYDHEAFEAAYAKAWRELEAEMMQGAFKKKSP